MQRFDSEGKQQVVLEQTLFLSTVFLCSEFNLENIYSGVNFCGKNVYGNFYFRELIFADRSLRASSAIWASEVSLARTRERGAGARVLARLPSLAQIGEIARRLCGSLQKSQKLEPAKISCHTVGKEAISSHSHGQDANPSRNYPQHWYTWPEKQRETTRYPERYDNSTHNIPRNKKHITEIFLWSETTQNHG